MNRIFRKAIACLLAVLMVAFSVPFTASAAELNRKWWEADGLQNVPGGITAEPSYFGYNSTVDPAGDEYIPWETAFGDKLVFPDAFDEGYEDNRDQWKPVIAVTTSLIGENGLGKTGYKNLYNKVYAFDSTRTYAACEADGTLINPTQLQANTRIAVTFEVGGFDILSNGQIKGTYDTTKLVAAGFATNPTKSDTWKRYTESTSSAWAKTAAIFYGGCVNANGQNTNNGTFYINLTCAAAQAGEALATNFLGTGKDDECGKRPFGEYGIVAGVLEFEVLDNCDLTEALQFDTAYDGTEFEPIPRGAIGGNAGRYLISYDDSPWTFANFATIWSKYEKEGTATHVHSFEGAVVTTNNDGTHSIKCTAADCDKSEGWQKDVADCSGGTATCTEKAICTICGEPYGEIDANNHDIVIDEAVPATCTEDGLTAGQHCSRCNDATVAQEVVTAKGHSWDAGIVTTEPTETTEGVKTFTCTVCDETKTEPVPVLPHSHKYTADVTDPTCTTRGYTTYTCACGESYIDDYTDALGHDIVIDKAVAATCTTTGLTAGQHCTRCNDATVAQEVDPATGHDIVVDEAVAPTCTVDGLTAGQHCSRCDDATVAQEVDPALGHDIVVDEAVAPTCTADGLTAGQHCTKCDDATVAQEVDPALGHNYVEVPDSAVAPTYEFEGKEADQKCTRCDDVITGAVIAKLTGGYTVEIVATDLGTTSLAGEDATDGIVKTVAPNSTVKLTAEAAEGAQFIGWKVGNNIVTDKTEYTATILNNVVIEPVFAKATNEAFTVVFMDSYGNVIKTQLVSDASEIVAPDAPTRIGYTFTGWSVALEEITEATSVIAVYEKDTAAKTYTVTAEGCDISVAGAAAVTGEAEGIAYNTKVTVTKAGTAYWTINGATVAYGESYSFYVGSDVVLTAVEAEEEVVQAPTVSAVSKDQIGTSAKVVFLATRNVPDGYTLVRNGFVYGKHLTADELTLEKVGTTAASGATIKVAYNSTTANQFSLTYGVSAMNAPACARPFLVCKNNATGEQVTVYSAEPMVFNY